MKTPFEFPIAAQFDEDNLVQRKPDKIQRFRHGSAACLCVGHVAEKAVPSSVAARRGESRVYLRSFGYLRRRIACGSWSLYGSVTTWVDLKDYDY
jgi:hypothetical protein